MNMVQNILSTMTLPDRLWFKFGNSKVCALYNQNTILCSLLTAHFTGVSVAHAVLVFQLPTVSFL